MLLSFPVILVSHVHPNPYLYLKWQSQTVFNPTLRKLKKIISHTLEHPAFEHTDGVLNMTVTASLLPAYAHKPLCIPSH